MKRMFVPNPMYYFIQIDEAINQPKGDGAKAVAFHGWGMDPLLDCYKDSLSEDRFSEAEHIAGKLREYITRNLASKFKTRAYSWQLVSDLKVMIRGVEGS